MAAVAQWKLRRLASRAIRVVERRGPEEPALKSFETTLVPIAEYVGDSAFQDEVQVSMTKDDGTGMSLLMETIDSLAPTVSLEQLRSGGCVRDRLAGARSTIA